MITITEFTKNTGVKFTTKHNDKMSDLCSLSTSPLTNDICIKRSKNNNSVCSHCYSCTMNKRFKNLNNMLVKNANYLCNEIIPDELVPRIYSPSNYFRFEAFGDISTEIQVVNYFKIATANSTVQCALWTKNPWIIKKAMINYNLVKPANLIIIGSSWNLNKPMIAYYKRYDFIDHIFTVYSSDYIQNNDININCGARSCTTCGKCYTGLHTSYEINEKLK